MKTQTVLAVDFGTSSIGFAIGQSLTGTAQPINAVKAKDGTPSWEAISLIINHWQPDLVVVGLPLNMDGTEQEMTHRAKKFANRIHGRYGLPVTMHDERLTTADAKSQLFSAGGYKKLKKELIDSMSAVVILESWFENQFE